MKLSDVMSAMQLSAYAEIGLVLFLIAFALIVFDLARKSRAELECARYLPLADDEPGRGERKP